MYLGDANIVAKRIGLSRQYAHLLWTGHRPISRRMAERIAAATKIPYTALLTSTTPTPPPRKRRPRQDDTDA
jgi:transcriptional regulator with XRE-family HTH domain